MTEIDRLLAGNQRYVSEEHPRAKNVEPLDRVAVLTCMDTRIDPLAVFGLALGDAHVLRNAGARLTDDVLRSLALSVHLLGVRTIVVMQHTQCGLAHVTDQELRRRTGADIDFHPIWDHGETLQEDVNRLVACEFLTPIRAAAGLLLDTERGTLEPVIRWSRQD